MLRDYQARALAHVDARFAEGRRAVLVASPTGSGKTRMGAAYVARRLDAGVSQILWLAHRTELVEQAAATLESTGLRVGVIAASSERAPDPSAPVQVASTQTLLARPHLALDPGLVALDEAHHYPAEEWASLMMRWPRALRLGLSATPAASNGAALSPLFDSMVVAATIRGLTAEGHLAPLDVVAPSKALRAGQIAQSPVAAYEQYARGRQAVVFAPHVAAANAFADAFDLRGIRASIVYGDLPADLRRKRLAAYEAGDIRVLVNVGILTEGWDHPPTGVAILARRCGSIVLYLQIAGRILRPHPSKARALFIDLTGAVHLHGRPDDDRVFSLEGQAIRRGEDAPPGSFCGVCGALLAASLCEECGYERPAQEAPKVVSAPMRKLARDFCAGDSAATQVGRLARWIREGSNKGHKLGAAKFRFKACYGRWPTSREMTTALDICVGIRSAS